MKVGLVETMAIAGGLLFAGYGIRRVVPFLGKFNVPAAVIGGVLMSVLVIVARSNGLVQIEFDTTLQRPLMIAFFTTLGFAASYRLLKIGGPQVFLLLLLTSAFAVIQNVVGIAVAVAHGLPPLFGVLTGSVTLTGGPATGLAFAPLFEQAGVPAASAVALATAMAGIVLGALVGAPVATMLIERHKLHSSVPGKHSASTEVLPATEPDEPVSPRHSLKAVTIILVCMALGDLIGAKLTGAGITLPAYIGAMLVAAALRNFDDLFPVIKVPHATLERIGSVCLSLFLTLALMSLDLSVLGSLAQPLLVNLTLQLVLVALVCFWPLWRLMGRDYDSAVMCGGFIGFMLGTTANAMAVMRSVADRYGEAARAFLVAPLVGAFFLDFTNALIITALLNILH